MLLPVESRAPQEPSDEEWIDPRPTCASSSSTRILKDAAERLLELEDAAARGLRVRRREGVLREGASGRGAGAGDIGLFDLLTAFRR
jgi:hypothetical protein